MSDTLKQRLERIEDQILGACAAAHRSRNSVRLIAVTKTHDAATVQDLINLGVSNIGENRVQEIVAKAPVLHGVYELHMIGHLQTNKVTAVLPYIHWLQSVDRIRLIERIEHCYTKTDKLKVLVEINTSGEDSKSGCTVQEYRELCERVVSSPVLQLKGLMTIGPLNGTESQVRQAFQLLRSLSERITDLCPTPELSMGMSGDFVWAIEEGATMVRIGTALVGGRN
ncbi:MAG TPA: YggS family pyridoxal phosphate-dependent enzyme [Chitinispirillaceae bacterium]|nr:YggS family pyridoxal phosphate-dependent enzyme [Chitinispirillaceae bacterium]